jgi:hypothetical protein
MNVLYGYGFPFEPQHSSCSNRKPKNFRWEFPPHGPLDHLVLIDNAILQYELIPATVKNLYGWLCESRSIVPDTSTFLNWNFSTLEKRFKKIFVSDKQLASFSPVFQYCPSGSNLPWIPDTEYGVYPKSKLVSMVASAKRMTKGHIIRHEYADRFKEHLDLFGGACGSPRLPDTDPTRPWMSKMYGLKDYMFSVVVENDFYDNYYTEKITDCFATGTIPVYLGSPTIGDVFNMDGIIQLDSKFDINMLTEDLYKSKLNAVHDNLNRVINLEMSDDTLWNAIYETRNN